MRKRFRGIMSFLVAVVVVFTALPVTFVTAENASSLEQIVEIEDAFSPRSSNEYASSEFASGGAYAILDGNDIASPEQISVGDFEIKFDIEKKGTYRTYIRVMFPKTDNDKFYVSWDHNNWETCELGSTANKFKWILADERKLTAGEHKLVIARGETGGYYDAVYVCSKDGVAPPEEIEGVSNGVLVTGYNLVHKQETIPVITDSYLFEAETATFYAPFAVKAGKGASGSVVSPTKAKSPNRDVNPTDGTPGKLEFKFIAGKTADYYLWIRKRTPVDSSKNIYFSYNGSSYSRMGLGYSADWEWICITSKSATEGQECTISFYERFKDLEIDSMYITSVGSKPSGKDGTPVAGSDRIPDTLEQGSSPIPTINPPANEHPRILFTKEDIPQILANLEAPQNEAPVSRYKEYLASDYDGTPNGREYYQLPTLEAKAFHYALTGDKEMGRKAVDGIIKYLEGYNIADSSDVTRDGGNIVFISSEIYDWCYDLINVKEKKFIMDKCIAILAETELEWPLREMGTITGHGNEAMFLKDVLAFAIATYDERPDIWSNVGGRFYDEYVPVRQWFNQAGYHHQGASYGLYRHRWDTWAYLLITGMGAPEPYDGKDLADMAYQLIYQRRPDGQYFRDGDNHQDSREKMWGYWGENEEAMSLDQAITDDPYIKNEFFRLNPLLKAFDADYSENASPLTYLIHNNPNTEAESYTGLPQARYFGSPVGLTIARTGWNDGAESPDAIAWMNIGEQRTNNHQHANSGAFQLYYKGILASRSGIYQGYTTSGSSNGSTGYSSEHVWMYASKSIAYNTMLIYDPSEAKVQPERGNVTDGGQRAIFSNGEISDLDEYLNADSEGHDTNTGKVVAQEIDPKNPMTPEYTYLKGDLTKAYLQRKCEYYDRSFMFLDLDNEEVPATLIVYDRVTSTNPDFKKTWVLHTQEQPVIEDKQIVAQRTLSSSTYDMGYNGKLTVDSLLPKNSTITVVGSEEEGWHTINGVDWTGLPAATKTTEGISYRIEISPEKAATTDRFLNVLQVADAGTDNYFEVEEFETPNIYGVQISDRVVTFAKETNDLINVNFETKGEGTLKYTVCDVASGTWEVTVGENTQTVFVTEDGKVLAFYAPSGKVTAKKVSEETVVHPDVNDMRVDTERKISVRVDNFFVYSKEDSKLVNGSLYIPMSILEKYYSLKKSTEGNSTVYTNHVASVTIPSQDGTGYIMKNGSSISINVFYQNGELMIPARAVIEAYGATIQWDKLAMCAFVTTPPKDYSKPEGYANIKSIRKDFSSIDTAEDNIVERMLDEDVTTHWGAKGVGRYADFELDREYKIESIEIVFNPNNARNAAFEIWTSLDGKTWETVFVGSGDGSVEEGSWEKFVLEIPSSARWIRYVANGSNKSEWNGVKEIRFKEAK